MVRGRQTKIPSPGQNAKVPAFGAINFASGRHLEHVPSVRKGGKNSAQFILFLGKLAERARRTRRLVILVLDNGPIHTSKVSGTALAELEAQNLIVPLWLPKYCPELNEQERVWRVAKQQGIANVLFKDRAVLRRRVRRVLRSVNDRSRTQIAVYLGHRYRKRVHKKLGTPA